MCRKSSISSSLGFGNGRFKPDISSIATIMVREFIFKIARQALVHCRQSSIQVTCLDTNKVRQDRSNPLRSLFEQSRRKQNLIK